MVMATKKKKPTKQLKAQFKGRPLYRKENNPDWKSNQRYSIIADMINTSSRVNGLLNSIKDPIKTAIWKVDPNGADQAVVDYVNEWVFDRLRYYKFLTNVLKFLDYGYMTFEKVYYVDEGKDWIDLQPRFPYTIIQWDIDTQKNKINGAIQAVAGGSVTIPFKRLFLIVNEPEGLTPIGKSILRSLYRDYILEDKITVAAATGLYRNLMGIPVANYPDSIAPDDEQKITEMLENVASSDNGYFAEKGDVHFRFQAVEGSLPKPDGLLTYLWQAMNSSQSANMLSLATSNRGSRAVGSSLAPPFYNRIAAIAKDISNSFQEVINEAVDMNFNTTVYPKLVASGITAKDFTEKAYAIAALRDFFQNLDPEQSKALTQYIFDAFEIPISKVNSNKTAPKQKPQNQNNAQGG
jgi:hypothetical protein